MRTRQLLQKVEWRGRWPHARFCHAFGPAAERCRSADFSDSKAIFLPAGRVVGNLPAPTGPAASAGRVFVRRPKPFATADELIALGKSVS